MIGDGMMSVGESVPDDTPVEAIRYLGPSSKNQLGAIGITTAGELKRMGVIDAYLTMKHAGMRVSLNFVWAMYAGLMGWDFGAIPPEFKQAVRREIDLALKESEKAPKHQQVKIVAEIPTR